MKTKRLLATLERRPLGYRIARQTGFIAAWKRRTDRRRPSRSMTARQSPSGLVRKILVKDIGLAEDEARKLL